MPLHKTLPFECLHKAIVSGGLLADRPVTPEGFGDLYWAFDANGGDGALFMTNEDGDAWVELVASSGGALALNDLTDVDAPTPTNTYALLYNSGAGQWQPQNVVRAFGTGAIIIDITGVADGKTLAYDAVNSKFVVVNRVVNLDDLADVNTTSPAKGDLLLHNGSIYIRQAVGTNGQVLVADNTEASGVKWTTTSAGDLTTADTAYINMQDRTIDPAATPASDYGFVYIKNGALYLKLDDGSYVGPIVPSTVTDLNSLSDVTVSSPTKGMLLAYNGTGWNTLASGSNGQVLSANSATSTGLEWVDNTADTSDAELLAILGWA